MIKLNLFIKNQRPQNLLVPFITYVIAATNIFFSLSFKLIRPKKEKQEKKCQKI